MAIPGLQSSIGAVQIGSLFSVFLFGIETLQTHLYYQQFPEDAIHLKIMVGFIWLVELAHTFCVSAEIYRLTIIEYGQILKLLSGYFPYLAASTCLSTVVTLIAHVFFSGRIWRVMPKPWNFIGAFFFVVAIIRFIGSMVVGVEAVKGDDIVEYSKKWGWLAMAVLIAGAIIDIGLSSSLVIYLYSQRRKVFSRSTQLIDKLVQFAVCTGLLPSLTAIALVIAFNIEDRSMVWVAIYTCLAKLYSNSVLAALNTRASLRSSRKTFVAGSSTGSEHRHHRGGTVSRGNTHPNDLVISVEMKSTVTHDIDMDDRGYPQGPLDVKHAPEPTSGWTDGHRVV
ncbi:hypothetical protein CC2G_012357 [Coprinopsis cinerea AmutBmut pab1-1]|nr:hypothetical protein CC2G_012357 [Coprinopsis cinerea AmutBmut pab1-1]